MRPSVDFVLSRVFSVRLIGASGVVVMIAPLPALDSCEEPYIFLATTLTYTPEPHSSENGDDLNVVTGIVHVFAVETDISQSMRSTE